MNQSSHVGKSYTINSYVPPVADGEKSVVFLKPHFGESEKLVEVDFSKYKGRANPFLFDIGMAASLARTLLRCIADLDGKEEK